MIFANLLLLFEKYDWSSKVFPLQSMSSNRNHCIAQKRPTVLLKLLESLSLILVYSIIGLDRVEKVKDTNCCCNVVS